MIREYLVSYGRAGHLGRFSTSNGAKYVRGDRVVIKSRRGFELGEVLDQSRPERAGLPDDFIGELHRSATSDDIDTAIQQLNDSNHLCEFAETVARELSLPFTVLDVELMLDGRAAILHGLPHQHCDAGPLLEQLGEHHGLIVRLYDMGRELPPPAPADGHEESFKCDKPNCGEGECTDCGTGGCNSCSAGTKPEDLEALFSRLRAEMEQRLRVPLT